MFKECERGTKYVINGSSDTGVKVDDLVYLYHCKSQQNGEKMSITINPVTAVDKGECEGKIAAFDSGLLEYEGLKRGGTVRFKESEIQILFVS